VESLRGQLLIAGSGLLDPNFRRAIVLVGHHDEEGAVGVVLNRPTEATVWDAVPQLGSLVGPEERVFVGGPVQPQAAVLLAEFDDPDRAGLLAFDRVGFLVGDLDPDDVGGIERARVFAGYAGWGPGQLEEEMEQASWILEPARPDDVFTTDPDALWVEILRRKGGDFVLMATMPADPTLN
jgi:putative transcriptional regulator